MKQLLFLLLFPCLALAQYQGNANQKITLGEQTTADGLVWRGVASIDTVTATSKITRANKQDTSAFLLLDTTTNLLWHYKIGSNAWTQAGGSTFDTTTLNLTTRFATKLNISDTSSMLTNYYRSGRALGTPTSGTLTNATGLPLTSGVTGVLPVANGGTNTSTAFTQGSVVFAGASGTYTQDNDNLFWNNTNKRLGIGTASPSTKITIVDSKAMGNDAYISSNTYSYNTVSSNSSSFQIGTQYSIRQNIATGSTNSGYLMGMDFDITTYTNSSGFSGSLNNLYGQRFHFGNESGGGNTPTITNAYGIYLRPFYQNGTISNLYALYIGNDATGGTVTNNFGIYQATSSVKNYFNGNIGIGTTSPSALLNVMGTVRINSASAPDANYYLQLENSSSQKAKANAWDTYSDRRIKTDIQPIFNAIDKVNLLNPVYYQKHDSYVENDFLNIDYDNSVKSLGFIAQEVYNVIPEAVNTGTTNELWAMDYTKIIPILTKAIQEQQAFIKALEQRIINLENK